MPGRFEFVVLISWREVDHFWADSVVLMEADLFYQALYGASASVLSRRSFELGKAEYDTRERQRREWSEGKRPRFIDSDDDEKDCV